MPIGGRLVSVNGEALASGTNLADVVAMFKVLPRPTTIGIKPREHRPGHPGLPPPAVTTEQPSPRAPAGSATSSVGSPNDELATMRSRLEGLSSEISEARMDQSDTRASIGKMMELANKPVASASSPAKAAAPAGVSNIRTLDVTISKQKASDSYGIALAPSTSGSSLVARLEGAAQDAAALQLNDRIVCVNGQGPLDHDGVVAALRNASTTAVNLTIVRGEPGVMLAKGGKEGGAQSTPKSSGANGSRSTMMLDVTNQASNRASTQATSAAGGAITQTPRKYTKDGVPVGNPLTELTASDLRWGGRIMLNGIASGCRSKASLVTYININFPDYGTFHPGGRRAAVVELIGAVTGPSYSRYVELYNRRAFETAFAICPSPSEEQISCLAKRLDVAAVDLQGSFERMRNAKEEVHGAQSEALAGAPVGGMPPAGLVVPASVPSAPTAADPSPSSAPAPAGAVPAVEMNPAAAPVPAISPNAAPAASVRSLAPAVEAALAPVVEAAMAPAVEAAMAPAS